MTKLAPLTFATILFSAQTLFAGTFEEVNLAPITHEAAALVVVSPDGTERTYTPADLEEMTTYSLTTTTPWREVPATFEGVMLADLLAANGLADAPSIVVVAENDFTTVLDRELTQSIDILVATRVDGRPHNRRDRGPIQFVIDNEDYLSSDLASESHLVWMAARIYAGE